MPQVILLLPLKLLITVKVLISLRQGDITLSYSNCFEPDINGLFVFACLAQSMASSLLQKSNMMHLSREATSKDKSLKTQLLLSTGDEKKLDTEKIWNTAGFFEDQTADFTINKANFPEYTLVYAKQGNVTPVKGDLAVYLDYVILGQLIPAGNSP